MNHAGHPRGYWAKPDRRPAAPPLPKVTGRIGLWLAAASVFLAPFNILRVDTFYFTASDAFALAARFGDGPREILSARPFGSGERFCGTPGSHCCVACCCSSSLVVGIQQRGFIISAQYLYAYFLLAFMLASRPWAKRFSYKGAYLLDRPDVPAWRPGHRHPQETRLDFVSRNGRFIGWVERENECATLIALAVPLLLWLVASGCARPRWAWIGVPLFAYGIVLTGSNTGLIGLVFALTVFVVMTGSWRRIILLAGSSFATFFIAVTWGRDFLPAVFQRRVLNALQNGDIDEAGTFADRMRLIKEAIGKADNNSLLGIGADQYRQVSELHAPVHNTFLLIWVEAGLPGLIGFLLLLVAGIVVGMLAARLREGRIAAICTLATVLLFAALANALPHLYGRFFVVPLLLGIAPSVAILRDGPAPRSVARFLRRARSERVRLQPPQRRPI